MPDTCKRHTIGDGVSPYPADDCPICRIEVRLAEVFAIDARGPRYRYWRIKRSPGKSERTFEYTTETVDGGKYWAIERRWVRVKRGERGKIIRKVGFKLRKKAKERAHEWYTKARTPAPTGA